MLVGMACEAIVPVDNETSAPSLPLFFEYFDLETFEVWEVTDIYLRTHRSPGLDSGEWEWCRHYFFATDSVNGDACPVCSCLEQ